jgi:hypothetical protein
MPSAIGVPVGVGRPRGRATMPQEVELPVEVTHQVQEGEGDGEEGTVGHDGGAAQRRARRHWCVGLEGPEAAKGYRGTPCCSRGPC